MCWNAEVSLQSFILGAIGIVLAYVYKFPLPFLFFYMTIILMQLVEYVVWSNYDDKNINFYSSLGASFLLFLQPVAAISTLPKNLAIPFLIAYLALDLFARLFVLNVSTLRETYKMYRAENGHLSWNFLKKDLQSIPQYFVYFFFLFVPFLISKDFAIIALALITLSLSLFTFFTQNTWGSMWCWIINIGLPFFVISQIMNPKK